MNLTIVSPQRKYEYSVEWISGTTHAGSLVIKPGHAPIILSLIAGSDFSFVLPSGEKKIIGLIAPCFLEVTRSDAIAIMGQTLE